MKLCRRSLLFVLIPVFALASFGACGEEVKVGAQLTYHLMPQGMPDATTRLQVTALDQVIARLLRQGKVEPRAVEGLVFPEAGGGGGTGVESLVYPRGLPSTTTPELSPEGDAEHGTPYPDSDYSPLPSRYQPSSTLTSSPASSLPPNPSSTPFPTLTSSPASSLPPNPSSTPFPTLTSNPATSLLPNPSHTFSPNYINPNQPDSIPTPAKTSYPFSPSPTFPFSSVHNLLSSPDPTFPTDPASTFPSSSPSGQALPSSTSPSSPSTTLPISSIPTLPSTPAPSPLAAAALDSFTLCLWFRLAYLREFTVILSYNTHKGRGDTLTLGPRFSVFVMEYMDRNSWIEQSMVEPQRWHLACMMRDGPARRASLFLDGARLLSMDATKQLPLNGTLVLGNDQDYPGGGFIEAQSAPGSVTGLYLWPRILSRTEILAVGNCDPPGAALLPWEATPWDAFGDVQKQYKSPCHERGSYTHFLLPIKVTHGMAHWMCQGHGLTLPFPTSEAENQNLMSYINTNLSACASAYSAFPSVWLDVTYDEAKQRWLGGPEKLPVNFTRMTFVTKTSLLSNPNAYITDDGEWISIEANGERCTMCVGTYSSQSVYIHGLCRSEGTVEQYTTLYPRTDDRGVYYLRGASGLHLRYDTGNRWVIHYLPTNTLVGEYDAAEFFWGRKAWRLNGTEAVCRPHHRLFGRNNLTISWCRPGSFTCTSGQCVELNDRCSLDSECDDESDEVDCQLVHNLDDYQHHLPPYTPLLPLSFSITLSKLWSVDLMGQLVHVTFKVNLRWRDRRLVYHNLRDNPSLNVVPATHSDSLSPHVPSEGTVWHPQVQVRDEERLAGVVEPRARLVVRKMTSGRDIFTDLEYSGAGNDLEYSLEFESNVHCELNLEMYPFDSQLCSITASVTNVLSQVVQYPSPAGQTHPALPPHAEFIITSPTLRLKNGSTTARLSFCLHRRPAHHLFSTYLPTILLHLIGYSSFFLRLDSFQDRSVMSLTTLLALLALYSESLAALPSTSYLKHVDIWFIFSIAFLTAVVIVHIVVENPRNHKTPLIFLPKDPMVPPDSLWQRLREDWRKRSTNWKIMAGAKVGMGVTYVVFQCVYWGHVLRMNG